MIDDNLPDNLPVDPDDEPTWPPLTLEDTDQPVTLTNFVEEHAAQLPDEDDMPILSISADDVAAANVEHPPIIIEDDDIPVAPPPPKVGDRPTLSGFVEEQAAQNLPDAPNNDEQPTMTVSVSDLFEPEKPLLIDEEETLPPRPIKTTPASEEIEFPSPSPDDEATVPPPIATYRQRDRQPDTKPTELPPRPQFNPAPRPSVDDQEATRVNPRIAFPSADRDRQDRTVEDVRAARRAQRAGQVDNIPAETPPSTPRQPVQAPSELDAEHTMPMRPRRITIPADAPEEAVSREAVIAPGREPVREARSDRPSRVVIPARDEPKTKKRSRAGCFGRFILFALLFGLCGVIMSVMGLALGYVVIANDLPSPQELEESSFETARIFDRNGDELYSLADPSIGNRTSVPLNRISPYVISATIATEDARFYSNPGFDPISIGRASYQAILNRDFTSAGGASTITQQVVRNLLLNEEERAEKTVQRKLREIILAAELHRTYTSEFDGDERAAKNKILELYLNEIYYGNLAYGIEAASQTYFDKPASQLTLAEGSLLAGLPQAPAWWDPITAPELALGRQSEVLLLMVASDQVSREDAQAALNESAATVRQLESPEVNIRFPHFTLSVLAELETLFGNEIYRGGFQVFTTIDPEVQRLAEETLAAQRANINAQGANNASLVSIDPRSGQILALVGSLDFNSEEISGQVNMARAPRQPGSTIKPFVFLAALEQGWTPSTLIWDVPTAFPDGLNPDYVPKNFDDEFHGPLRMRPALGNSYNIPAVKALEFVGVCNFIGRAQVWGLGLQDDGCIEQGSPRNTGLSLALGGGEISALEMASAYAMLANQGSNIQPYAITRIELKDGTTKFQYQPPSDNENLEPISAEYAYLMSDILSDNGARSAEFEPNNFLTIQGHQVAAKTGTSGTNRFDVRDAWTIGYTPDIVTAVWVGNTNNEPLAEQASGYRAASPIWNQFMVSYLSNRQPAPFNQPDGIIELEICSDSGTLTTPECADRRSELFSSNFPPASGNNHFFRSVAIDLWSLRLVNENCDDEAQYSANTFNLLVNARPETQARYQEEIVRWLQTDGQWWANRYGITFPLPDNLRLLLDQFCEPNTARPRAVLTQPFAGEVVNGLVQIGGQATAPGFTGFQLEYGIGNDPQEWIPIGAFQSQQNTGGQLGLFDTNQVEEGGDITIRLTVFGPDNPYTQFADPVRKEARVVVQLEKPTPTPTPTDEPTATPTNTPTPEPDPTETPTPIPQPTDEPTAIPTEESTAEPEPTTEPTEEAEPTLVPLPTVIITTPDPYPVEPTAYP